MEQTTGISAATITPEQAPAETVIQHEAGIETSTETEEAATYVHCTYTSTKKYINGGWVNIWPTTYLVNAENGDRIQLAHAVEIPVHPERHYFNRAGEQKNFVLIFPKLPSSWTCFHLIEYNEVSEAFTVRDIMRNDTGIYRVRVY